MTLAARQKGGFTLPFRMTLQFGSALYQTAVILTRHSGARSCASAESITPVGRYCSTCGYGFRARGQEPAPRNDNVDGSRPMRVGISTIGGAALAAPCADDGCPSLRLLK